MDNLWEVLRMIISGAFLIKDSICPPIKYTKPCSGRLLGFPEKKNSIDQLVSLTDQRTERLSQILLH